MGVFAQHLLIIKRKLQKEGTQKILLIIQNQVKESHLIVITAQYQGIKQKIYILSILFKEII